MNENTPNSSLDDITKFLAPLVDILNCDRTTLNKLCLNHKEIVSKINQTGRLLLLEVDGQTLLICNANMFFDLEKKRQALLSTFTAEDALELNEVRSAVADPRIGELQDLKSQIACHEAEILDALWQAQRADKELEDLRTREAALTADLNKL